MIFKTTRKKLHIPPRGQVSLVFTFCYRLTPTSSASGMLCEYAVSRFTEDAPAPAPHAHPESSFTHSLSMAQCAVIRRC